MPRRRLTAPKPLRWASNLALVVLDSLLVRVLLPAASGPSGAPGQHVAAAIQPPGLAPAGAHVAPATCNARPSSRSSQEDARALTPQPQAEGLSETMHDLVKNYYGRRLKTSDDLKTSACCDASSVPGWLKPLLSRIHPEVLSRYYGCGLVAPPRPDGLRVLDLGSGSGRDVYAVAQLVGERGEGAAGALGKGVRGPCGHAAKESPEEEAGRSESPGEPGAAENCPVSHSLSKASDLRTRDLSADHALG